MDIQYICDVAGLHVYVVKYVTKSEKKSNDYKEVMDTVVVESLKNTDRQRREAARQHMLGDNNNAVRIAIEVIPPESASTVLTRMLNKFLISDRDFSAQETAILLDPSLPLVLRSRPIISVPVYYNQFHVGADYVANRRLRGRQRQRQQQPLPPLLPPPAAALHQHLDAEERDQLNQAPPQLVPAVDAAPAHAAAHDQRHAIHMDVDDAAGTCVYSCMLYSMNALSFSTTCDVQLVIRHTSCILTHALPPLYTMHYAQKFTCLHVHVHLQMPHFWLTSSHPTIHSLIIRSNPP